MVGKMTPLQEIKNCINQGQAFVLQGGAGSGKTETLKDVLGFISNDWPLKKIACITHTNKAVEEIRLRVGGDHLICTIHSFLNGLIKNFEKNIHEVIHELFIVDEVNTRALDFLIFENEKDKKKMLYDEYKSCHRKFSSMNYIVTGERVGKVEGKREYDVDSSKFNDELNLKISVLNKRIIEEIKNADSSLIKYNNTRFNEYKRLTYGHDGLLNIASLLFKEFPLLAKITNDKYDYIFIDEYQDTSEKIIDIFLNRIDQSQTVIGLFGDSMQSIYGDGIGDVKKYVDAKIVKRIDKEDNYRCSEQVIDFINTLRTDGLKQELALKQVDGMLETRNDRQGSVQFMYSVYENKPHVRSPELEKDNYRNVLNGLIERATFQENSKILMLSNTAVATKAGFPKLYQTFAARYTEPREEITRVLTRLLLRDLFELCDAYSKSAFNLILAKLKNSGFLLKSGRQKIAVSQEISQLLNVDMGISEALNKAFELGFLKKTESFEEYKNRMSDFLAQLDADEYFKTFEANFLGGANTLSRMQEKRPDIEEDEFREGEANIRRKNFYGVLLSNELKFREVLNYFRYEEEETPYVTMHKTKGTGIENVLLVLDEYFWNQYDFNAAFDIAGLDQSKRERNMQLIYVACSRAKSKLRCVRLVSPEEEPIFLKSFHGHEIIKVEI